MAELWIFTTVAAMFTAELRTATMARAADAKESERPRSTNTITPRRCYDVAVDPWPAIYDELVTNAESFGTAPWFRGHCRSEWTLLPTLARVPMDGNARYAFGDRSTREANIYYEFVTRAGEMLPGSNDSWATLFIMQHHGLPTRLLDWTDTLGVAIYFAVRGATSDAAIWLLDPYELNKKGLGKAALIHPHKLDASYEDYFIENRAKPPTPAVAISPLRHDPRVSSQRSGFTLHKTLDAPLEELHEQAVRKITIPAAALTGARRFLNVARISEFSLFRDLDSLAKEIYSDYF